MGTLSGSILTPFNFSEQLNLQRFIGAPDRNSPTPFSKKPLGTGTAAAGSKFPVTEGPPSGGGKNLHGLWDHRWQGALFAGETGLMVAGLTLATVETVAEQQGNGIQDRDGHLGLWTTAGLAGGAALGNLSCALLDINNDYGQCDLVGGLLGSLAAFFLADHFVAQDISGIGRNRAQLIQVTLPNPPVLAQPVEEPPVLEPGHRWPTDSHGP